MEQEMKIAKIISKQSVVINAGDNQGIKVGQKFQIIGKFGTEPVIDPDTGESLGMLDELKGIVTAKKVYPRMTIAESGRHRAGGITDTKTLLPYGLTQETERLNRMLYGSYVQDSLNVDEDQITGGFEGSDEPIKIGDIVRKI